MNDFTNEIWNVLNSGEKTVDLLNSIFLDERKVQKTLNKLINNDLIVFNKEDGIIKQKELTPERYVKAIMLEIEIDFKRQLFSEERKKKRSKKTN